MQIMKKLFFSLVLGTIIAICWVMIIHALKWIAIRGNEFELINQQMLLQQHAHHRPTPSLSAASFQGTGGGSGAAISAGNTNSISSPTASIEMISAASHIENMDQANAGDSSATTYDKLRSSVLFLTTFENVVEDKTEPTKESELSPVKPNHYNNNNNEQTTRKNISSRSVLFFNDDNNNTTPIAGRRKRLEKRLATANDDGAGDNDDNDNDNSDDSNSKNATMSNPLEPDSQAVIVRENQHKSQTTPVHHHHQIQPKRVMHLSSIVHQQAGAVNKQQHKSTPTTNNNININNRNINAPPVVLIDLNNPNNNQEESLKSEPIAGGVPADGITIINPSAAQTETSPETGAISSSSASNNQDSSSSNQWPTRPSLERSTPQVAGLVYKAPFFTSWFVSSWNILFMPIFTLISSCCFRSEDSSTKKLLV